MIAGLVFSFLNPFFDGSISFDIVMVSQENIACEVLSPNRTPFASLGVCPYARMFLCIPHQC